MATQVTEALLGLIIAALIIMMIFPSCQRFFEFNRSQGYDDLIDALNNVVSGDEKYRMVDVRLKEDSFIVVFSKKSNKVLVGTSHNWRNLFFSNSMYIKRPSICKKDMTCVCFCAESDLPDTILGGSEIECENNNYKCTSYAFDIPYSMAPAYFYDPIAYSDTIDRFPSIKGGFFLFHDWYGIEMQQPLPITIVRLDNKHLLLSMNSDVSKKLATNVKPEKFSDSIKFDN